jgi:hypothetical protein
VATQTPQTTPTKDVKSKLAQVRARVGQVEPEYQAPDLSLTPEEELALQAQMRKQFCLKAREIEILAKLNERLGRRELADQLYNELLFIYQEIDHLDRGDF